ncbi:protein of unknown function [Maridesulfovibrio hydrothermalis AM13 = DSM 14728]|uniref:Uncharacterized protein n=1 Tax=Maridesulfovibrio hydrothermalis AM13 = DSM 14728 TaxID=1121451 RepID=L0RB86_9BACT|nr:protein of unknown function [Maridesulfovibrio hydrothermalis AM13 = DSM 14728]
MFVTLSKNCMNFSLQFTQVTVIAEAGVKTLKNAPMKITVIIDLIFEFIPSAQSIFGQQFKSC